MPGFDGTGPGGMGSMTGGARGFCAVPLQRRFPIFQGRRFTRPFGSPFFPGYVPYTTPVSGEDEISYLRETTDFLSTTLKEIEQRIEKLESSK